MASLVKTTLDNREVSFEEIEQELGVSLQEFFSDIPNLNIVLE
jgi:hypothetical protein